MKRGYKNLLSVLGGLGLILPLAGCETDAQEAQAEPATNPAKVADAGATTGAVQNATVTAPDDATKTAAAGSDASTALTNVATATTTAAANTGTNAVVEPAGPRIPTTLPANVMLSKGVEEVIKLAQAGLSETVILLYIEKFPEPFDIDAAEIVYLNDIGIASTVLAAMLNHDGKGEDVLHEAFDTNKTQVATAPLPPPQTTASGQLEVSSNYVAQPGPVVTQDPYAQAQAQVPVVVEQQPTTVVVEQQPAVTYSYFYSSLAPYGSWVSVPDYGWCWQPTIGVTHRSWRPYLHGGRWLNSDVGWYWHSDYSWGWAPFHYGRWHCAPRYGWVWTPDYTWGPSWVTWRSSGAYCGWAPLPPHCDVRPGFGFSYWGSNVGFSFGFGYSHNYYAWVPSGRFCDRRLTDHVVHSERTANIYKDSTVVNNYIVGNNNTIVNNGISRDEVRSRSGSELPRVRVADASSAPAGRLVQPDRPVREGTENVVYRPERPAPSLVRAHEQTRSRNELARPADASPGATAGVIPARTERPQRGSTSPALGVAEGQSGSGGGSRPALPSRVDRGERGSGETARSQIATVRPSDRGVFATPAPVRPEPDRSAEILRNRNSRSTQEALVRPSTGTGTGGSLGGSAAVVPSRPAADSTSRPTSQGSSIAPRFTPGTANSGSTASSGGRGSTETVRPNWGSRSGGGANEASPALGSSQSGARNEVGRPRSGITAPAAQQAPSGQGPRQVETGRPGTSASRTSPGISQPRSAEPARSPDLVRPQPQVSRPAITQSPSVSRPAPTAVQPVTPAPIARSNPNSQARETISISPQPIQRSTTPSQNFQAPPSAVRPSVTPRTESFSRPSSSAPTIRSAPPTTVVRPAPVTRSQSSSPSISSSPSSARSSPSVSSAPINGGSFRSAPPASAGTPTVSRPSAAPSQQRSAPQQSSPSGGSSGRGRVEIGR